MKIIYHANCLDGFTAAWVAWRKYGDDAEYIAANYGDEPVEALGEDLLILDFSYPRRHLEYMAKVANSIRVLDHHKTAEADLAGLDFCTFDMKRSGAGLAWDALFGTDGVDRYSSRPSLVNYVEDRDLWKFVLEESRAVSAFVSSFERTFATWGWIDKRLQCEPDRCIAEGQAILRALNGYVDGLRDKWRCGHIGGYDVPVINTTHAISELVGALAELQEGDGSRVPFAAGWFQRQDGKFIYSLRSRGEQGFDVSAIAKQYGGGGHKNAAGFTVDKLVHE
jgi:oligoribonuclease NrnB/cAMP/cGMP phosphodiesterase (DHH superfamily)